MAQRCLIITYYFPPDGGGGVQRVTKLIKFLHRKGWRFTVVCASDNNPDLPYDETLLKEIPQETEVIRLPGALTSKKSTIKKHFLKRVKSNFITRWISALFLLPDSRKNWLKLLRPQVHKLLQQSEYEVVLISNPPYSLALFAAEMTRKYELPVVLDMRDPWSTNPYKIHPSAWHRHQDLAMELRTIAGIRHGISAYESLIEFYKTALPNFEKAHWECIPNGFDDEDFENLKPQALDQQFFHIAFSGTFYSHINKPHFLFKAMAGLENKLKSKIRFHHIGHSVVPLKKIASYFGMEENVVLWGYRDHAECLNILAGMDALCFILDSQNPNAQNTIGGKVYEYLKLKKPVLALVPEKGEAAHIIKKCRAGQVIDPYNTAAIRSVLEKWIDKRPQLKHSRVELYARSKLADRYHLFLTRILQEEKDRHPDS